MVISFNQKMIIREKNKGKKLKKPSKWLFPYNLERKYRVLLHKLVRELTKAINEMLIPLIPTMLNEVTSTYPKNDIASNLDNLGISKTTYTRNDDFLGMLSGIILSISEFIKPKVQETIVEMEEIGNQISNFNQTQFEKVNKSVFGIDIFIDQPFLQDQLELFSKQNAQLIVSLPEEDLFQVSGIVERGLQQGSRFTEISKDIQKRFGISRRRANLISRDQTTKLNASLTMLRQESAGITEYIWQTSGDERVRPTHRTNDGKKFSWNNPSKITGHPGHDVNCRCVAIPVMEGVIE